MATKHYRDQVKLLLDVLPLVMAERVFALKGGTAINLFEWDMPRLSVDIDLTYLPNEDRAKSLQAIGEALGRIKNEIETRMPPTKVTQSRQGAEEMEVKLHLQRGRTQVKIEVNPSLRGHLMPVRLMQCSDRVQDEFAAFVEVTCLSHGELFGGKICAALDRQHPRDLFDVKQLLDQEGLSEEVRLGMITALVSHGRPIADLIKPRRKDQGATFRAQFEGMPFLAFTYADHKATLDQLVDTIHATLTDDDRIFLHSFEAGEPEWACFPIEGLSALPGPQFKLLNIAKFRETKPEQHAKGLAALDQSLS
jgi:predicted nucleotidyltransferase component of viral defense system